MFLKSTKQFQRKEKPLKFEIVSPKVLYVAIDVAKYYHKAIIFDLQKNILEQPFSFNISREGLEILLDKIKFHAEKNKTNSVVVGLEATAHYHENLTEHLKKHGFKVLVINPFFTFKTRSLKVDYVKTDEIDLKAIAETMLLGKGKEFQEEQDVYKELKLLTRFRRAKNQARKNLKNQMLRDLDRLWPALLKDSQSGQGLFFNPWKSKVARALLKLGPQPQQIAIMSPIKLLQFIKDQGIKGIGLKWAVKIIEHAKNCLGCESFEASVHQQVLQSNLILLENLDKLIENLDCQIAILLPQTHGAYLLSIRGISIIRTAEFIGEIGHPYKYHAASEWVKLAGLDSSRYQSGKYDRKNNPITKTGNSYLRASLFSIARDIARWEPYFKKFKDKLTSRGKHIQVAYGAVANKFLRVAFSLMLRKTNFDGDYEKKEKVMPDPKFKIEVLEKASNSI